MCRQLEIFKGMQLQLPIVYICEWSRSRTRTPWSWKPQQILQLQRRWGIAAHAETKLSYLTTANHEAPLPAHSPFSLKMKEAKQRMNRHHKTHLRYCNQKRKKKRYLIHSEKLKSISLSKGREWPTMGQIGTGLNSPFLYLLL